MLRLEKNGAVALIEETGAEMRAYQSQDGKERLWSGDPEVWAGVAPVLFPVIGNLKDGAIRIGGKTYEIPKHGFARHARFQVVEQVAEACTLVLEDSPETRAVYPFSFRLTVTHSLLDQGFSTTFLVENRGDSPMPFVIGGHPGFACPMEEGADFSDYQVLFEKAEEGRNLLYTPEGIMGGTEIISLGADSQTIALSYEPFDEKDTLVFPGLNSRSVKLLHKETGKGLRFSFPQSPVFAIWTKPQAKAPYVCLEPWNGLPALADETGDFENKPYHIVLGAGERFQTGYQVEIIEEGR